MFAGLWTLTWLETKIFVREPLGVIGTIGIPVLMFVVLGRVLGPRIRAGAAAARGVDLSDLPVLGSLLIATSVVLSLITIIAIYREGGILKRLRATPLRPHTILVAHVLVKLLFTAITLAAMIFAGRRYYPMGSNVPFASFTVALLFTTLCIMSLGFLIASVVPTARFAQPIGTLVLYPMFGVSGLFVPVDALSPALQIVARMLPMTYAVSLLKGVWGGEGWAAHAGDVSVLAGMSAIFTLVSVRVFRWE
ncbi:MAG TPA: ABC transporter permease [Vicinamibacterales bacterium]|nr:ABC transporter permease [Vicinamibacterales bacterium]